MGSRVGTLGHPCSAHHWGMSSCQGGACPSCSKARSGAICVRRCLLFLGLGRIRIVPFFLMGFFFLTLGPYGIRNAWPGFWLSGKRFEGDLQLKSSAQF